MKFREDHRTSWKTESKIEDKPWGYEINIGTMDMTHTKILFMRAGCSNTLKFYMSKNESLFLRRGKIKVVHGCEYTPDYPEHFPYRESFLTPGQGISIQSGCPYQIFAIEDSEIYEMGDKSSSQRVIIDCG
jgi:hypothetical protein